MVWLVTLLQPYLWFIAISTLLFLLCYQHYLSSLGQIKNLDGQSTHFVTSEPCLSHLLSICLQIPRRKCSKSAKHMRNLEIFCKLHTIKYLGSCSSLIMSLSIQKHSVKTNVKKIMFFWITLSPARIVCRGYTVSCEI